MAQAFCPICLLPSCLREVLEEHTAVTEVARIFGVSDSAIHKWVRAFRRGGDAALTSEVSGPRRSAPSDEDARRALVVRTKQGKPAS